MGLLNFLKKDTIINENKTKPFYQNSTDEEIKDWFSRTRPWHKVDANIINALINRFGNSPMLEVFVITSMENNLVKEYEALGKKDIEPDIACSIISGILVKEGEKYLFTINKMVQNGNFSVDKLSDLFSNAVNLFESSITVEQNQFYSYLRLAELQSLLNKKEATLKYVQDGLRAIKKIKESNIPFNKSSIPSIQNGIQLLNEIENILLSLQNKYS